MEKYKENRETSFVKKRKFWVVMIQERDVPVLHVRACILVHVIIESKPASDHCQSLQVIIIFTMLWVSQMPVQRSVSLDFLAE